MRENALEVQSGELNTIHTVSIMYQFLFVFLFLLNFICLNLIRILYGNSNYKISW